MGGSLLEKRCGVTPALLNLYRARVTWRSLPGLALELPFRRLGRDCVCISNELPGHDDRPWTTLPGSLI